MIGARILSTGLGVPSKRVTNDDLSKIVETNDEWIRTRTGICERRFLDTENGEYLTDICKTAGEEAIAKSGLTKDDIDLTICCTVSAESPMPNNSAKIIDLLGLKNSGAFDLSAACSGFMTGLHVANGLISSGMNKNILLFGAEAISAALNMEDRKTCVLFGDGAGAVVISGFEVNDMNKDSRIIASKLYAQYDKTGDLKIEAGGSRFPAASKEVKEGAVSPYIEMNGQEVFKAGVKGMARAAKEVMAMGQVSADDIKWFVPHQANLRMIDMVAKLINFPKEKVFVNLDRWGNTSAATVAIALAEMDQKDMLQRGDLILCDVFGGGFSYGAVLIRW